MKQMQVDDEIIQKEDIPDDFFLLYFIYARRNGSFILSLIKKKFQNPKKKYR